MTTLISSEAQKLAIDIGKKITIEQCHTINIILDKKSEITKPFKPRNVKNLEVDLAPQLIDKS